MPITTAQAALVRRTAQAAFFQELGAPPAGFVYPMLSTQMDSDQDQEEYAWLGQVPQLREWVGLRTVKSLPPQSFTIANRKWETTVEFDNDLVRRDKLGQVVTRSRDLARRAMQHRERLFVDTVLLGAATNCYDGQFMFDTDHSDPGGVYTTSQSNDLAETGTGVPAAPTAAEFEDGVENALNAMRGFLDDQGEPWNVAEDLHWLLPTNFQRVAGIVLGTGTSLSAADSSGASGAFRGEGAVHVSNYVRARQTALGQTVGTTMWLFNSAPVVRPVIYQLEREPEFETLGPGSDHSFKTDNALVGVNASYNMGYGPWQHAVQVTFS